MTDDEKKKLKALKDRAKKTQKLEEALNKKALQTRYRKQESNNAHSENAVMLARHFGTSDEHEFAKNALKKRNKQGGWDMNDPDYKKLSQIHSKLYPKLFKEENLEEGLGSPTTAVAFSNLMRSKTGSTGSNPDPKEKKKPEKKIKDTGLMASLRKKLYGV